MSSLLVSHKSSIKPVKRPWWPLARLSGVVCQKYFNWFFCQLKVCWRTHLHVFITFTVFPEQGSFFKHLFVICRLSNRPFLPIVLSGWVGGFIRRIYQGNFTLFHWNQSELCSRVLLNIRHLSNTEDANMTHNEMMGPPFLDAGWSPENALFFCERFFQHRTSMTSFQCRV